MPKIRAARLRPHAAPFVLALAAAAVSRGCWRRSLRAARGGRAAAGGRRRVRPRRSGRTCCSITPLVELGSPQIDYVRAARRSGIRTALCVWSWDHLSSKALIRVVPDARAGLERDAARRGGRASTASPPSASSSPARSASTTGSTARRRAIARAFCRAAGLPDDRPFVLYVCSALFRGSPSEAAFVRAWLRGAARARATRGCATCDVLVRPHPQRLDEWEGVGRRSRRRRRCWGSNPIDEQGRADYFDSLYPQRRGRRPQHQRAHRGGDRRPPGAHDPAAASSTTTRKARTTSTTC